MMRHLQAVADRLAALQYLTHLVAAPTVTAQYLVLGGPAWGTPEDLPLCGTTDELDADFRVTAVTGTAEGVGTMLRRIRDELSPSLTATLVALTGRRVWVRYVRSEVLAVDRDLVVANTNRHPFYGVDTYHLTSEPT